MIDDRPQRFPACRRTVLKAGVLSAFTGMGPVLGACSRDRPARIIVGGGEEGGFYLEFAQLLANALERHGAADSAEALATGGSLDNLESLISGRATCALVLADSANQREALVQAPDPVDVLALGRVYENYLHCIVRKSDGFTEIGDLAGKVIAVGERGSGTSLTTPRILTAAGLISVSVGDDTEPDRGEAPTDGAVKVRHLGLNRGLEALKNEEVDALFWSGGVPTAAIAAVHETTDLALLDLASLLPAIRASHGYFYDRVLIPANTYEEIPPVWTIGVANLLMCRHDLDHRTASAITELLALHADELIPRSTLGIQFLSPASLINTAGIALHPAAAKTYQTLHK